MTTRLDVDLLSPAFYGDLDGMHEAFTWMRANEPVYRDEANGLWGLTRHADVLRVERDDEVFISGQGYRARYGPGEDNIIAQDNPGHLEQRRLVVPFLVPAAVAKLEPFMRSRITEMVDRMCERGRSEVVEDLAAQLPSRLTCHLLGMPEEDWPMVKGWSERLMRIDSATIDPEITAGFMTVLQEMGGLIQTAVPDKRANPGHDLLSTWATANVKGCPMADTTIFNEVGLFVSGGAETTRTVIARGLHALAERPDQWARLVADPSLVPTAVEELIRWVTPLNNMFRTAVADAVVGGTAIAAGDRVVMLYPSANRDEAVFADPFTLDVTRSPNPHLAFGNGTHFCVGATLARAELRLLFDELVRRIDDLEVLSPPDVEDNIFAGAVRSFELAFRVR